MHIWADKTSLSSWARFGMMIVRYGLYYVGASAYEQIFAIATMMFRRQVRVFVAVQEN